MRALHGLAAAGALLAAACFTGGDNPLPTDFGQCEVPPEGQAPGGVVTYYEHVKPILDARCATCHQDGSIGPFQLESYQEAFQYRNAIRAAVLSGEMPPWQPDDCCQEYRWDLSLTADQVQTIAAWVEQGAVPGDPSDEGPPLDVDLGGLSRVDLRMEMPEPFTPRPIIGADEVRCFLLGEVSDEEVYVRGMDVVPGERREVHHVIVGAVKPEVADRYREKEGHDGRPGWDCWGDLEAEPGSMVSLGGWTPGARGVEYPDELGTKIPAGWELALQMHYDTGTVAAPDQTAVELMLADSVDSELKGAPVMNPFWLAEGGMPIAAGDDSAQVFFSYDPTTVVTEGNPFLIYAVNIHMHELGSVGRIAILREDGTTDCILNITDWDFDWLGTYWLEEPVLFEPGDELFVECNWDNTASRQKFVDGEQIEPRDIDWGTDEEMCAGILTVVWQ